MDPSAVTPPERKHAEATGNGYNQASDGMNQQIEDHCDDAPPPSYQETYPTTTNATGHTQVELRPEPAKKSILEAYMLLIILGFLGLHHFYLRRPVFGIIYFFTGGLLGVGYVVDWFRLVALVRRANLQMMKERRAVNKCYLDDAYVLWFPLGLLGFHHYYLRRPIWGILYTFTVGLFGIGWLIDGLRMHWLVKNANKVLETTTPNDLEKKTSEAHALAIFPLTGLLGFQHYYLGRYNQGFFYTLTLGNLGIGWIVDLFRIPSLVKKRNKQMNSHEYSLARLDDAYLYLFPIGGLFGLHHFYLRRPLWGVLYFITWGLFGVGCVIDLVRLYWLVEDYNRSVKEGRIPGRHVGRTGNRGRVITHTTVSTHIIQRTPVQGQVLPQSQTTQVISEHDALLQPSDWGNTPRYTTYHPCLVE